MLKTLDVLIGVSLVMILLSMVVTLFTQALGIIEQVGGPNHPDYFRVSRLLSEGREP